jgi:hypothetical protein
VPALRIELKAAPTISPVITPTVMIVASAPWPFVSSRPSSAASVRSSKASVAPSESAVVRFSSTGSTAMMRDAPAWLAPWIALAPMPPTPMTMTTSPGPTCAAFTADPQPVGTAQPSRAATSRGTSLPILIALHSGMTVYSENAERRPACATSSPFMCMR